jgi:hypothetical protein
MGIAKAIARVRHGVRQRTSELGEQLHSESIPERLRPAAVRLAALLRVSPSVHPGALAGEQPSALDAAASPALAVAPERPSSASTRASRSARAVPAGWPTSSWARAGGELVAPVSAPELPPVLDDALASSEPEVASEPVAPAAAPATDQRAARRAAIARAASASAARPHPAPSAPADSATRPKPTTPARQKSVKRAGGVATKPGSANSSARPDGKAASKRPSAKATRKK